MSGQLRVDLFAPGMTALHRVGAAGLWMTLRELEGQAAGRHLQSLGGWQLGDDSVTVSWEGSGEAFFSELFRAAYPIDDGLIRFAALPSGRPDASLMTHSGMLGSFLQHPRSRTAERGGRTGLLSVDVDGEFTLFPYLRVSDHPFRSAEYRPDRAGEVVGWLFPGGVERHVGLGAATRLREEPQRLLALRFAPIGCIFFQVRHLSAQGVGRVQVAVAIPDLETLGRFAEIRRGFGDAQLRDLHTAGAGEAALRLLLAEHGGSTARRSRPHRCQVVAFGSVAWNARQRTRVDVIRAELRPAEGERAYRCIRRSLQPQLRHGEHDAFWDVPQVPELAAENVIAGRAWWTGFGDWIGNQEIRKHILIGEREGLKMIVNQDEALAEDSAERAFVGVCHQAWRQRLGQLGSRAREQGIPPNNLFSREQERWRIQLSRSKTRDDLRSTLTDLWARSGSIPALQDHWPVILPFLDRRWREGRDLALLALASYRRDEPADNAATEPTA